MGRRGNPYDNAKAESFMETLKVEAVYLMAYETFEDVTADLPRGSPRPATCQNRRLKLSTIKGALQIDVRFRAMRTLSRHRRMTEFDPQPS
jgi:transposase InsO family protein